MAQTLVLAVLVILLAAAAAGCGGSKPAPVASLGTTVTTGAGSPTAPAASRAALAACFGSHGFPASVGSASTSSQTLSVFGVQISGNVDPGSAQFQAALQACRKFIPGGGPPALTPAQEAEAAKAMLSFAACMRKDGVPTFPDPNGQGRFPLGSIGKLDPSAPLFQSAFKSCQPLEPKVGPRIVF
ncbi:MAG TPA: hypothetical protein VG652_02135 [Gaiellaceae bacterium]|nr:hypothetical protein [Gaiellaceae bacterium]